MPKRTSGAHRRQRVLRLLQLHPYPFSIKEIVDYYRSTTGEVLNRNSLRKTLEELVEEGKVSATYEGGGKRGRGRYFVLSTYGVYQDMARAMRDASPDVFLRVAQNVVPQVYPEEMHRSQDLGDFIELELPTLYPLTAFTYDEDGTMKNTTVLKIRAGGGERFVVDVRPCLCGGDPELDSCCNLVAAVLSVSSTRLTGRDCDSRWTGRERGGCSYELLIRRRLDEFERDREKKQMDLNDPHDRERVIPGLN